MPGKARIDARGGDHVIDGGIERGIIFRGDKVFRLGSNQGPVFVIGLLCRDALLESDWDFLILVDGPLSDERTDRIRHRLWLRRFRVGCPIECAPFRQN